MHRSPNQTTRRHWIATAAISLITFLVGMLAAPHALPAETEFTADLLAAHPELDGHSHDLLMYGVGVCAALDDGQTYDGAVAWMAGTPYDYLHPLASPTTWGQLVVDSAIADLCPGAVATR